MIKRMCVFLVLLFLLPPAQQQEHPRLLIIGDSVSFGLAASEEGHSYRALVTEALGSDTGYIRATTLADVPTQVEDYDIIVLEIGLNDVLEGDSAPIQEGEWATAYGAVLERLQAHAPLVVATTPPHLLYPQHERYAQMARYAEYVKGEAEKRSIRVADLWAMQECVPACLSQEDDYTPFPPGRGDNFHPNDLGHWRIARAILHAIHPQVYVPAIVIPQEEQH